MTDTLQFLNDLPHRDVKPGLERIRFLLKNLGHPEEDYPAIHVAGSNGKGSTATVLSSILSRDNKVGSFTSPPMFGFEDRIKVNGKKIGKSQLSNAVEKIKPAVKKLDKENNCPTLFEAAAAIAAKFFSDKNIDLAVLETGMGGKFDATKPLGKELVSLITNIELEHADILGPDLEDVTEEIAGITGGSSPLILGKLKEKPREIIEEIIRGTDGEVFDSGDLVDVSMKDFHWGEAVYEIKKHPRNKLEGKSFSSPLVGKFQEENFALALASLEKIDDFFAPINWKSIKKGLETAELPGRFQLLSREPPLLVDGAHNPFGIRALVDQLSRTRDQLMDENDKIIQVFTALKDKDVEQMVEILDSESDAFILTELDHHRQTNMGKLRENVRENSSAEITTAGSPEEALNLGIKTSNSGDLICTTGSLYLVKEAIEFANER